MIEFLCILMGVVAGITVVGALLLPRLERRDGEAKDEKDAESIMGSADQLQLISNRLAANVSAHNAKMGAISQSISSPDLAQPERLVAAINEIFSANQAMQSQLELAQRQIKQQTRLIEQASQQARTDVLTGLANRRALDEFVNNSIQTNDGEDNTSCLGLVLFDIDHFKSFNDTYGHITGDAVLSSFAKSLAQWCGDECYPARYGGEEFAVVFTDSSLENIAQRAANLRHFASSQMIQHEDLELNVTASAGLCAIQPGDQLSSAYERADEGLYRSKKNGRNQGFWLSHDGWLPFPQAGSSNPKTPAKPQKTTASSAPVCSPPPEPKAPEPAPVPAPTIEGPTIQTVPLSEDVLDLGNFTERLEPNLKKWNSGDLPVSAFMVEALGLTAEKDPAGEHWSKIVATVQRNVRGIDILCAYRPNTLCVVLPGCSLDAGIERVNQIKECESKLRTKTPFDNFAFSICKISCLENAPGLLNRLEAALDEAHDLKPTEFVVHNGDSVSYRDFE
ncbi:MAG: diguanylate cyclase [Planctomycetales bacterium]|nr:diguanylate cyclase [Planctomycetales bacterium]